MWRFLWIFEFLLQNKIIWRILGNYETLLSYFILLWNFLALNTVYVLYIGKYWQSSTIQASGFSQNLITYISNLNQFYVLVQIFFQFHHQAKSSLSRHVTSFYRLARSLKSFCNVTLINQRSINSVVSIRLIWRQFISWNDCRSNESFIPSSTISWFPTPDLIAIHIKSFVKVYFVLISWKNF